jgi:Uncharacterized protein conserved in bacteria (DUF2213)
MATSIVPGVLSGSDGALMYPGMDVAASTKHWDGVPLVVYHPYKGGNVVTAKSVPEKHIGVLRNSKYRGKLVHECWFDEDKTRNADRRVYDAIVSGSPMEVSTGLNLDKVPGSGVHKGKAYDRIARNYRPDHLAILPDQQGACSVAEGCGLNVNASLSPGDPNMQTNEWSDAAREAAAAARAKSHAATVATAKAGGGRMAAQAQQHADSGNHKQAIWQHLNAAEEHDAAAERAKDSGNSKGAALHRAAGKAHEAAAKANKDANKLTGNRMYPSHRRIRGPDMDRQYGNAWSDAAREAAEEARGKSKAASLASKAAGHPTEASKQSLKDSERTAKVGTGASHLRAAFSHDDAMQEHKAAATTAKKAGDAEGAAAHTEAAQAHKAAKGAHGKLVGNEGEPSDSIDPEKACQILKDGEANGKPLTEEQRGMFGAACGQTKNERSMVANFLRWLLGNTVTEATIGGDQAAPAKLVGEQVTDDGRDVEPLECEYDDDEEVANVEYADAYRASMEAAQHSMSYPEYRVPAMKALDAAGSKEMADAAEAHKEAAVAHEEKAVEARRSFDDQDAMRHEQAAAAHRRAASLHAAAVINVQNAWSDEAREGASAARAKSHAASAATEKAGGAGASRAGSAQRASDEGDHATAQRQHENASARHMGAGEKAHDAGDVDASKAHYAAAEAHDEAADAHYAAGRAKGKTGNTQRDPGGTMSRAENIEFLAANCACWKDPEAQKTLATLSDSVLAGMVRNEEEMHSFDSKPGSGASQQAGGMGTKDEYNKNKKKEMDDEEDDDEDDETCNARWLAGAPPAIREVVQNAMAAEQRQKQTLSRQLRRLGEQFGGRRKQLIDNKLKSDMTLNQMQELLDLIGAPQQGTQTSYMGAAAPVDNTSDFDKTSILPLPTINYRELQEEQRKGRKKA